ncbi:MAG: FAD-binding oxidoreductase [SAR202 cluster bacterium]|nr:FAD-binding oxidoreductase [SAR202 cluster bacterium]
MSLSSFLPIQCQGITSLPAGQLPHYAVDGQTPQAAVRPANCQQAASVLQWAAAEKLSVMPWGGGTQMSLGNSPSRYDLALDLRGMNHLLDFQPNDLTCTVEAGMTLAGLQAALAQGGKFLPLEAPLAERATIGGVLAAGASGPLRFAFGLPRDWLIGIGVVSGQGVMTRAGGKVVKNVTGYDLNKLYTGSLGTLGVIVEATFKLSPLPAAFGALLARFDSMGQAVTAGQALCAQVFAPQGLQVIAVGQISGDKSPLTSLYERGEGLTPPLQRGVGGIYAIAFFAGRPSAVKRRLEDSARFLPERGAKDLERLEEAPARDLLHQLTDLGWSSESAPKLGLKISVPPSAVGQVVAMLEKSPLYESAVAGIIADAGFGTVRLLRWGEEIPPWPKGGEKDSLMQAIAALRAQVRALGGAVVVEQCPLEWKSQLDVWDDAPQGLEIMRRLKQKFDPQSILNPGRFLGRL